MPPDIGAFDFWVDVSPLRPDELAKTMRGAFMRPYLLQEAYKDGVEDARAEQKKVTK